MRASLTRWIGDADALGYLEGFNVEQASTDHIHVRLRRDDYYIALVGELFDLLRNENPEGADWARIGNALLQLLGGGDSFVKIGISEADVKLFSATSFYLGGFPASAYLTIRNSYNLFKDNPLYLACYELLARPSNIQSPFVLNIHGALLEGNQDIIRDSLNQVISAKDHFLREDPYQWIALRLLECIITRFLSTNIRAVLPDGHSEMWNPLVRSLLTRKTTTWEFFPSQIQAIEMGVLNQNNTFSLQMPTGAGKTTLCETILFSHAVQNPGNVAILLVPYRSLAAELRGSLVRNLNTMGILSRSAYGGTVPTSNEVRDLDDVQVVVATPETLSGMLSADPNFLLRISLLICDEGHLLDSPGRGIVLELLLARLRSRDIGSPRFIFVSAIVPNIEQINNWLGGTDNSVVRSDYRAAIAEFGLLKQMQADGPLSIGLEMHPHEDAPLNYTIDNFLSKSDFKWTNAATGRANHYNYSSVKAQAIAASRKLLPMGMTAVFAANKRGNQGATGLAEELLAQIIIDFPLPRPLEYADLEKIIPTLEYLHIEYGDDWIVTRSLSNGIVLHHGDIPQQTREVLESLLRNEAAKMVICTSTLAEGVNLPIRSLVLYSVQRRHKSGHAENLLTRDIKNLVGRAGRAGSNTKGLVVCANGVQWPLVEQVALQAAGERVVGSLYVLLENLKSALATQNVTLNNEILEDHSVFYPLIDGVDSLLIDLMAEEVAEGDLENLITLISDQTYASSQSDDSSKDLLKTVFRLRTARINDLRANGKLNWIRETGAKARLINNVEISLFPRLLNWDTIDNSLDPSLLDAFIEWAWEAGIFNENLRVIFRKDEEEDLSDLKPLISQILFRWVRGERFVEISQALGVDMDTMVGIHTNIISYSFQTAVEQGIAIVGKILEARDLSISQHVVQFLEQLRFGVPNASAAILANHGLRHRSACVTLSMYEDVYVHAALGRDFVLYHSRRVIAEHSEQLAGHLGALVYSQTLEDLKETD